MLIMGNKKPPRPVFTRKDCQQKLEWSRCPLRDADGPHASDTRIFVPARPTSPLELNWTRIGW